MNCHKNSIHNFIIKIIFSNIGTLDLGWADQQIKINLLVIPIALTMFFFNLYHLLVLQYSTFLVFVVELINVYEYYNLRYIITIFKYHYL